ncbi:hypothetical protein Aspvir_009019 [Aspergillus viridinutans]|uniref:Uncharacterized protein n=1 Tax=Aspergillus viridinutans TaxID=75553 RepID=A0A9P3C461_ASPVI|nr:uncharacterized protein Aspvir_009019 [Aspergillus viridinutans]GIK04921.1 hypothetical protein Aspvir_009019 [Aspergillus viridinutans]
MNLPLEIFELIISSLLPVDAQGDVILYHQQELSDLRLVCRIFDEVWSRCFVSGVCASYNHPPSDIQHEWPSDSVIWVVRTVLLTHSRRRRGSAASSRENVLGYIFATADSISHFLLERQADKNEKVDLLEESIHLVSMAFVFNNEFKEIMHHLGPGLWKSPRTVEVNVVDGLELAVTSSDLLPLLVLRGNVQSVRDFLSNEKADNINHCNKLFGSALYNAAALNELEIVELLLAHGADVNHIGGRWHTPLQASVAYMNATAVLSVLLKAGADVNLQGGWAVNNKRTVLMTSAHANNREAVSILLSRKDVDVNLLSCDEESIVHYLCRAGDGNNLRKLLAEHPDADVKHKGEFGTALHAAMNLAHYQFTEGHDEVVGILLELGLSPYDVSMGCETDIVGWAENIKEEAEEDEAEIPAAVQRILGWRDAKRRALEERRGNIL